MMSALRAFVPPAINFMLAYLVIQLNGKSGWGEFVDVLIYTSVSNMFISFGIKDYVLRQASLEPNKIGSLVKDGIAIRLLLVLPFVGGAVHIFSASAALWIGLWLTASLIHAAIDPIINFNRSYLKGILSEVVFGTFLFSYLAFATVDLHQLIVGFSLAAVFRTVFLLFHFRENIGSKRPKFNPKLLLAALPFLLMGLAGMLQSKTDLYLVSWLLQKDQLAIYQVTANLFIYVQALSAFLVLPFSKNLYRFPARLIAKLSARFSILGLLIIALALPAIYAVTEHVYHFNLSVNLFAAGALYVLPTFMVVPVVYKLTGLKKERSVLAINLVGAAINLICSYFLILKFGIIGGLVGSAIAKWIAIPAYFLQLKRHSG